MFIVLAAKDIAKFVLYFSLFILLVFSVRAIKLENSNNLRPIVGIFSQPKDLKHSFIVASYVKYLESAGARVVPILYNSTKDQLKYIFNHINGAFITGGGQDLNPGTPFYEALLYIYNLVIEANTHNDYFPLWGTCMGFQALCILTANNSSILEYFDSYNISMALEFTKLASISRLYGNASSNIISNFANKPITMNNHHYGVTPDFFNKNLKLQSFYNVLSTNLDRKGKSFVSSMEAKNYPIYGVQYHPEKNLFEWDPFEDISHTVESVEPMQYLANFFIKETRKNLHHFSSASEESKYLIYNYNPSYDGAKDPEYEQVYYF